MNDEAVRYEVVDRDSQVLSIYLDEINRIPLLSHEEELELATKAQNGDRRAREQLIRANLRFVVSVAKKYRGQGLPLGDLINEGNLGLITALDKFEPDKGYHFISYAVWWIRQSIMKAISDKGRAIRLPLNKSNELLRLQKAEKDLMHERATSDISSEEIASASGLDVEVVNSLKNVSSELLSFDSPVKRDDDSQTTYGEFLEDPKCGPEERVIKSALKRDVRELLLALTEKERDIIIHRYGLDGNEPMSLKEIGELYSLTKERIRQIEKKALEKLREAGEEREIDSYREAI